MNKIKSKTNYKWFILIMLFFSQLILSMGTYGWGPLAPFVKKSLSLTYAQFGSFTSILYFCGVLISIPAGLCVDKIGVRINLFVCMLLMGIGMILASIADNYFQMLMIFIIIGVSYGMINPVSFKGLSVWFDKKQRGTVFGIRQMGVTAGAAISSVLLIYLAGLKSWNFAVLTVGVLAVLFAFINLFFYKDPPDGRSEVSSCQKNKLNGTGLSALIKDRNFIILTSIMGLLCLGQSSIASFLVLYLKEHLGFSTIIAGSFLTILMIIGGIARVLWGIISDTLYKGRRLPVLKIICSFAVTGSILSAVWQPEPAHILFLPVLFFLGCSFLGSQGISSVLVVELCGSEAAGKATGLCFTIAWTGMTLGPVIFGALIPYSYSAAWGFITLTSTAALVLCFLTGKKASCKS